jgi:hypothetical protein
MLKSLCLSTLVLTSLVVPSMAQQSGGLRISPATPGGPIGLARPLLSAPMALTTAQQTQNGMTASDHQAKNQSMITALRGDPGFLSGFQFGTPSAVSRQPAQSMPDDGGYYYRHRHGGRGNGPIIINAEGPMAVTVGNGNVVQQQSSQGATGPVAQQQVLNLPGSVSGAAVNTAGSIHRSR